MKCLEEIRNPISCTANLETGAKKYEYREEQVNAIEEGLKALDIIRKKGVNIIDLRLFPLSRYNQFRNLEGLHCLTKEEYELLKKILGIKVKEMC